MSARIERALRAHYRFALELYLDRVEPFGGGVIAGGGALEEPEWSHLALLREEPGEALWRQAQEALAPRPLAVSIDPLTPPGVERWMQARGAVAAWRWDWLLHRGSLPEERTPDGFRVAPSEDAEALFEVFASAYPGEDLRAHRALFSRPPREGSRCVHMLATHGEETAGVATVVMSGGVAGLYNLAVRPSFRGRGLADALTRARLRASAECTLHLLITERPEVCGIWERRGWERALTTVGLALEGRSKEK